MGNLLSHNDGCLSPDNCYDVSPHTPSNDSGITEPQGKYHFSLHLNAYTDDRRL